MEGKRKSQARPIVAVLISIIFLSSMVFAVDSNTSNSMSDNETIKQITKIMDFIFTAFNISTRLVTENNTPIGNQQLLFYENNTHFSSRATDTKGLVSVNYSPLPGTYSIFVLFNGTGNLTPSNLSQTIVVENDTNNTEQNQTDQNQNSPKAIEENITNIQTATELPLVINEAVLQGNAVIDEPVLWKKEVIVENPNNNQKEVNILISAPESVSKIHVEEQEINAQGLSIASGNLKEIYSNEFNILGQFAANQKKTYKLIYQTPAPKKQETKTANGKRIIITSDASVHYHNVIAYTDIPNLNYKPRLYRISDNKRTDVTDNPAYSVSYLDTDKDSRYDRIEWIVPQLSNDTYEIDLTILNVQSYPIVGGKWTVRFNTAGDR